MRVNKLLWALTLTLLTAPPWQRGSTVTTALTAAGWR